MYNTLNHAQKQEVKDIVNAMGEENIQSLRQITAELFPASTYLTHLEFVHNLVADYVRGSDTTCADMQDEQLIEPLFAVMYFFCEMCHAITQAVETMENYLSDSEIKDMIAGDQCTLTAEYRPQLTADLERIYDSLDDYDKGVLQDHLDDMWIMYCKAFYGAVDSSEGWNGIVFFGAKNTDRTESDNEISKYGFGLSLP